MVKWSPDAESVQGVRITGITALGQQIAMTSNKPIAANSANTEQHVAGYDHEVLYCVFNTIVSPML